MGDADGCGLQWIAQACRRRRALQRLYMSYRDVSALCCGWDADTQTLRTHAFKRHVMGDAQSCRIDAWSMRCSFRDEVSVH